MTDHSIAQLKRQMDEARSRKDVAMNVYLLAARAYEKACIAKAEEDAKAAGFIPGKTLVEWDNWRLEGPSFVWHYRGFPHVHVWVNVSDDASVPLNAKG